MDNKGKNLQPRLFYSVQIYFAFIETNHNSRAN